VAGTEQSLVGVYESGHMIVYTLPNLELRCIVEPSFIGAKRGPVPPGAPPPQVGRAGVSRQWCRMK
jgi:hypothetical protein